MNIIFKIILLNLLLIYSLKYNNKLLCLLIILFSLYMLYMYYYINNILEGNTTLDEYRMNFAGLLNKDIKTSYREDILYDRILDNFTRLLTLMDRSEGRVPPNQMCRGELGEWSECSRECGRGEMSRRFNVIQEAGMDGIKCVYENGQEETKECFDRLCKFHEPCKEDFDCLSNYCSKQEKICTYPHMCERDKLENCNSEQCQELENKYGDYTYDVDQQRCINKFIDLTVKELTEKEEISLEDKSIKERKEEKENEIIARNLNNSIQHICKISSTRESVNSCENVTEDNLEGVCNKYREGKIPCYYDYDSNSCKIITDNSKYTGENWTKISRELEKIKVDDQKYGNIDTAENFFNCENYDDDSE
jgi:hypothetical protein